MTLQENRILQQLLQLIRIELTFNINPDLIQDKISIETKLLTYCSQETVYNHADSTYMLLISTPHKFYSEKSRFMGFVRNIWMVRDRMMETTLQSTSLT